MGHAFFRGRRICSLTARLRVWTHDRGLRENALTPSSSCCKLEPALGQGTHILFNINGWTTFLLS